MTAALEGIPLGSLKRYLAAAGWRSSGLPSGIQVFSMGMGEDAIEIVLPLTESARGTPERIASAIATLSALENRSREEIAASIRAISYDLVRSRLPDSVIRHDTIKLGTAEEFIRRMNKILAASAHAELHISPYFLRVDTAAQRYADDCRFGHTFRGSFGFTVESPVGPNTIEIPGTEVAAPPLERRAILRLARGLRLIETAIEHNDPNKIVEGYETGLNANACEDLASLIEVPQIGEVNFEIVFSSEWGFPSDLGPAPRIRILQQNGVEIIREAARALRIVNYEKLRTIYGTIHTLRSLENPSDLFNDASRDVVVEWDSDEYGRKNVRVSLDPETYLQALEAHRTGKRISVTGELERAPRQWRLDNPRNFTLL